MCDFSKADCHTKCREMVDNSEPIGSAVDVGGGDKEQALVVLHLALIFELYETRSRRGLYFLHTHSHSADSRNQATMVDFTKMFPDTFQSTV